MKALTESWTLVPASPIRRLIGRRTSDAVRTIPHFRMAIDVEVDVLLRLREASQREQASPRISLTDLILKATGRALMNAPDINGHCTTEGVLRSPTADIALICALQDGLSSPVIRRVESKSVWEIAKESLDLVTRARQGRLRMPELEGGSFGVSNLGMHGVDRFDAIINAPLIAMLAVGAARRQVVPDPAQGTRIASVMSFTLSVDHRAADGVAGAAFLQALRGQLADAEAWAGRDPPPTPETGSRGEQKCRGRA